MKYDPILVSIADYLFSMKEFSEESYDTASLCLADALGCALLSLQFSACTKLLGPIIPGTLVPQGSRVPGTHFVLDPIRAAFNLGTMIRWLDFNDTWLAAEWGHPSDNIGALLPLTDYLSQTSSTEMTVKMLLKAIIQAYEIQGGLALQNSFNKEGFDHVILVKVATAGVTAKLLGGTREQVMDALSHAWIDSAPLRTYRHAPNTGSRKSWAAGDATSRGLQLAWMVKQGEMGYPSALTTKRWGFCDVILKGKPLLVPHSLGSYVVDNILFKVAFPAEFHAQTAVECAFKLRAELQNRFEEIERIQIETHRSALQIIDKEGALKNPADRDHCLQYMVAVALLYGELKAEHYEADVAANPMIDQLRAKMQLRENERFSQDYLNPEKRSIANGLTIKLKNGQDIGPVVVEYPLGHRFRRKEAFPLIFQKFEQNLRSCYSEERVADLVALFHDRSTLFNMPVRSLVDLLVSSHRLQTEDSCV